MNNKILAIFFSSDSLNTIFSTHSFFIEKLSQNFEKIYFLNLKYLDHYIKNKEISAEIFNNKLNTPFVFPKNFQIKNFRSKEEIERFLKNKEIIGISINNFGTDLPSLKLLVYLKKFKIHHIEINDISNIKIKSKIEIKYILKGIKFKLSKIFYNILLFLLSNIGLISKIEIKFTSKKTEKIFEKLIIALKLSRIKHLKLINSKAFDILNDEKIQINEDKITLIDDFFGHPTSLKLRGEIDQRSVKNHYDLLVKMLHLFSEKFQKEIVVCIHPKDDLESKKKIFSSFKVVKYKTRENILNSFLVIFFESSAIIDAIILKKKIITIYSPYVDDNVKNASNTYRDKIGIHQININEDFKNIESDLIYKLETNKEKYNNFIDNYVSPNGIEPGYKTIINKLKKNYF